MTGRPRARGLRSDRSSWSSRVRSVLIATVASVLAAGTPPPVVGQSGPLPTLAVAVQTTSQPSDERERRFRRAAELAGQSLADLESGNCRSAIDRLLEVERLLPDNLLPKVNLAICYSLLNQTDRALASLESARELAPDNPQALFATARILEPTIGDDDAARSLWQSSLQRLEQVRPRDPRAPYLRGTAALRDGRAQDALGHFDRALEHAPENLALLLAALEAAARAEDVDRAADAIDAVEDRLNGFDQRAQRFADQLRDAVYADTPQALRPPALVLQNLLRPTDLYRVGITELIGRGDGAQLFPQLDFVPPLPPSIQGGQDIDVAWSATTDAWAPTLPSVLHLVAARTGDDDGLLILERTAAGAEMSVLLAGAGRPRSFAVLGDDGALRWTAAPIAMLHVDLDQDGVADLLVLEETRLVLRSGTAPAGNSEQPPAFGAAKAIALPEGRRFQRMIAADFDQEGDLDVLLLDPAGTPLHLLNRGDDGLAPSPAPFAQKPTSDAVVADLDEDGDLDVVTVGPDGLRVHDNRRGGRYVERDGAWRLGEGSATARIAATDVDNDGRFDLVRWDAAGGPVVLLRNTASGLETVATPPLDATAVTVGDLDNDGDGDVAALDNDGALVWLRNRRDRGFTLEPAVASPTRAGGRPVDRAASLWTADLDRDGDLDLVAQGVAGAVTWRNDGGDTNQWLRVRLVGRSDNNSKNNLLGHGSTVELRSGGAYQAQIADGRVVHFGLGSNRRAEVLRVIWTNGLAQTQQQVSSRQTLVENQVLKGSCPFLYTWDGEGFQFHTDLMWRSTLGMTFSNGAPAPHQSAMDWIRIPGDRLAPVNGAYWLNMTAELWETIYLDRQRLHVVDHPADLELLVDETFDDPPHPRTPPVHWVRDRRAPAIARDDDGRDLATALAAMDEERVDHLRLTRFQGVAEPHALDLTFDALPPSGARKLVLGGWIFPTDTTINVALAQDTQTGLRPVQLEVFRDGAWSVLDDNLGLPMGKSKTMVIDLVGLLSATELGSDVLRLRVSTSMQIYWNHASLVVNGNEVADERVEWRQLAPDFADLHYRGYSALEPRVDSAPHRFDYDRVDVAPRFRDQVGRYTAYGDVLERLASTEAGLVIMNAGDELTLTYPAPQSRPGLERTFVLFSDGWVKDADVHTQFSQTVAPVPHHGMPGYDMKAPGTGGDRRDPASGATSAASAAAQSRRIDSRPFVDALRSPVAQDEQDRRR